MQRNKFSAKRNTANAKEQLQLSPDDFCNNPNDNRKQSSPEATALPIKN
jgi:hypothetical protein